MNVGWEDWTVLLIVEGQEPLDSAPSTTTGRGVPHYELGSVHAALHRGQIDGGSDDQASRLPEWEHEPVVVVVG